MKKELTTESIIVVSANFLWAAASVFNYVAIFYFPDQFNLSLAESGIILFLLNLCSFCGTILFSKLNYKLNSKQVFTKWSLIFAISFIIAGFSYQNLFLVFVALAVGFFAFSNITLVSKKMIIAATNVSNRRKVFGYNLSAMNLARLFIPALAVLFYSHNHQHIELILFYNGILVLCSGLLIHLKFEHNNFDESTNEQEVVATVRCAIPTFIAVFIAVILLSQLNFIIPQYTKEFINIKSYSLLLFTYSIMAIVLTPIIINVTERFEEITNISIGIFLMAISMSFLFLNSNAGVFLTGLTFGIGSIELMTSTDTHYSKMFNDHDLNKALVVNKLLVNSAKAINPLIMGIIISILNIKTAIIICIILAVFALLILRTQKKYFKEE